MLAPAREDPAFGLVLCGGESRRMGRDKARIAFEGQSLLERAVATLEPLCSEVWLASGPRPRYLDLGRLEVLDRRPAGSGPLAAIEAGLAVLRSRTSRGWLVVLACDMPAADSALFRELLERARAERLDQAGLESELGPEPLAAVLSADLFESVRAALDAGERKASAFERFPARHGALPRVARLLRPAALGRNLNTPADLEAPRA